MRAPSPHSSSERARNTENLMQKGESDVQRWRVLESLATSWDRRAQKAAGHIAPGSKVVDVGAGRMALRRFLPPDCKYVAVDLVEREPGSVVADLNKEGFPNLTADVVTLLGVLEYVYDVPRALDAASKAAPKVIVSYCAYKRGETQWRRGLGWVNEFTKDQFRSMLLQAGLTIRSETLIKLRWRMSEYMFECERGFP